MKRKLIPTALSLLCMLSLTSCNSSGWQTVNPPGTDCSFELPQPVNNPHREGQLLYEAKDGKVEIRVGVYSRSAMEVQPGASDAEVLKGFETFLLKGLQENLTRQGYNPELIYEGDLAVKDGLGQQIRISLGDQFILNQFYLTPKNLYYIKIDNGDKSNETVARFLESFQP